jgi:AraC-like DNA-binding protein
MRVPRKQSFENGLAETAKRGRIETTVEPVERIAETIGFGGGENMRSAFIRTYGQPPQSIRRAIRSYGSPAFARPSTMR